MVAARRRHVGDRYFPIAEQFIQARCQRSGIYVAHGRCNRSLKTDVRVPEFRQIVPLNVPDHFLLLVQVHGVAEVARAVRTQRLGKGDIGNAARLATGPGQARERGAPDFLQLIGVENGLTQHVRHQRKRFIEIGLVGRQRGAYSLSAGANAHAALQTVPLGGQLIAREARRATLQLTGCITGDALLTGQALFAAEEQVQRHNDLVAAGFLLDRPE